MTPSYRIKNKKNVVKTANGVYFTISKDQIDEMIELLNDIKNGTGQYLKEDARND